MDSKKEKRVQSSRKTRKQKGKCIWLLIAGPKKRKEQGWLLESVAAVNDGGAHGGEKLAKRSD